MSSRPASLTLRGPICHYEAQSGGRHPEDRYHQDEQVYAREMPDKKEAEQFVHYEKKCNWICKGGKDSLM